MAVTLRDRLARLPEERRARIEARAAELVAEEMTLRDLRRAFERTQVHLAERMGVTQETVSRLEKRSDMLLSTLRGYVEAMGGELELVARFPGRPAVRLTSLAPEAERGELCRGRMKRTPARRGAAGKIEPEAARDPVAKAIGRAGGETA